MTPMRIDRIAIALTVIVILAACASGAKVQPLPAMTAEKWRRDIDVFARELPNRHKNAFHSMTREQFAAEIAALRARAGTANDAEMIAALMRITAMVGDGHTYVRLPSDTGIFPINIAEIEDRFRVVRGAGDAASLVGGALIRIDETPIDQATARVRTIIPQHESEVLLRAYTPVWLSFADVLHGLGITGSPRSARFTVLLDDGTERSAQVTAIDRTVQPRWKTLVPNPPLSRQRTNEGFWFTWLPESATVYVNFRRYDDLRSKSRELWEFVDRNPVKKIAIDLRSNGGGDFNIGRRYMVDQLARRPKLRGYVIIGGRTFSAALKNAIDFRQVAGATLVGETIGERPNSYSENDEMTLPESRIQISYSTRYYRFLPHDGLVTPDQEIKPLWADWLAGRDPALDWILGQ